MLKLIPGNAQHLGAQNELRDSFSFSRLQDADLSAHGGLLGLVADEAREWEGNGRFSRQAVESFKAAYSRKGQAESVPAALLRSFHEAHHAVAASAPTSANLFPCAIAIAAAVVFGDGLYWIASGEGRIYLLRNGRLTRVNGGHPRGNNLRVRGTREPNGDWLYSGPGELPSHEGPSESIPVDMAWQPLPLRALDVVIVCSDGVYRALNDDEIIASFRNRSPGEGCEAVQARVLAKRIPDQDNLTILAIQCCDASTAVCSPAKPGSVDWKPSLTSAACLGLILGAAFSYLFPPTPDDFRVARAGIDQNCPVWCSAGSASSVPSGTANPFSLRSKPAAGHRLVSPPSETEIGPLIEREAAPLPALPHATLR